MPVVFAATVCERSVCPPPFAETTASPAVTLKMYAMPSAAVTVAVELGNPSALYL
jgi:hypothetical protein